MNITVKPVGDGYVAHIEGNAEISGKGNTADEAVGNLISQHQASFKLSVGYEPA